MGSIERLTENLEKPELDDRSYRVIQLENKLEALLVHDPDTDKASAAVNVNVGNFSDYDDTPGMAHAVEHLLFMGTKKVCRVASCPCFFLWLNKHCGVVPQRECLQPISRVSFGILQRLYRRYRDELLL